MSEFPWEKDRAKPIDHKANGFDVVNTQSGQKRAYADRTYEFTVKSDKSAQEVADYCSQHVMKCSLSKKQWLEENRESPSMENHFRSSWEFSKVKEGEYFYRVTSPYTD